MVQNQACHFHLGGTSRGTQAAVQFPGFGDPRPCAGSCRLPSSQVSTRGSKNLGHLPMCQHRRAVSLVSDRSFDARRSLLSDLCHKKHFAVILDMHKTTCLVGLKAFCCLCSSEQREHAMPFGVSFVCAVRRRRESLKSRPNHKGKTLMLGPVARPKMPRMLRKPEKRRKEKPRLATLTSCAASEGCVTRRDAFVFRGFKGWLFKLNPLACSLCQTVVSLLRIRGGRFRRTICRDARSIFEAAPCRRLGM